MAVRVRVGEFRASSVLPRVHIGGFRASGVLPTSPRVRTGGFRAFGPALSTVTPVDVMATPGQQVLLTYTPGRGNALPDSMNWTATEGTITITGAFTATFTAPSVMPPQADTVITATPVVGSTAGIPVTAYVHTLPQTIWIKHPGDAEFMGIAPQPA